MTLDRSAVALALNLVVCAQQPFELVDVQSVRAEGDPAQWVIRAMPAEPLEEASCDLLVAGAGMGGVAAALRASELGASVCMTEPTDWIGGQMTAGGVSALDEHAFIEAAGATRLYYQMREAIRDRYRQRNSLLAALRGKPDLNPGACYVSSLCFEPRVGVEVLDEMLRSAGSRIKLFLRTEIAALERDGARLTAAVAYRFEERRFLRLRAKYFLDATEMGDLLPLAKVGYVVGAESREETLEPHAPEKANPACVQSITYPFVLEHRPGENHRIERPEQYEHFRDHQPFSLRLYYPVELGWRGHFQYTMFGDDPPVPNNMSPRPFFSWRRVLSKAQFEEPGLKGDLGLMNWPRQDYHTETVLDRTPNDLARVLQQAKRLSFAFLYWLQNELERDDQQGKGYPELMLRRDLMGTADGLSKYPYIREARRLKARSTVRQQDIVAEYQRGVRAKPWPDSVGVGFYMVDIHPCGSGERGRMMMPRPFQIPMTTLVPQETINLLASGKNLGVTHLTNGAYRLHPIEWNVGEAAATIAVQAIAKGALPAPESVQMSLARRGVPLVWFDDLDRNDPDFAVIHYGAIRGIYPMNEWDLHAAPDAPATRFEAARALAARLLGGEFTKEAAATLAVEKGWMAVDHRNWFHGDLPMKWTDIRLKALPQGIRPPGGLRNAPVKRRELARWLVDDAPPSQVLETAAHAR